jgi:hypothetical protein
MVIVDDILADPAAYRAAVLAKPFDDFVVGPKCFHGIQRAEDETFPAWIVGQWPHLTPTCSFFRQSPGGQREPHYVHTDRDMGEWTAILYLNPEPAPWDGTLFWRHRPTGLLSSVAADDEAWRDEMAVWSDPAQWEPVHHVAAQCGRALIFPAPRFHSRALLQNYGTGDEARLVQVVFGLGSLNEVT